MSPAAVTPPGLRKRSAPLAALLALLIAPLGFAYVQRLRWGAGFFLAVPSIMFVAGQLGFTLHPGGYWLVLTASVATVLASMIFAARFARALPKGVPPKWYNRWYHYLWIAVLSLLAAGVLSANRGTLLGFESFRITAESMRPTLLQGDFIVADFRGTTMSAIHRGDLVVFEPPAYAGQRWIKRVVGLPGETIEVRGNEVIADGKPLTDVWPTVPVPVGHYPGQFDRVTLQADEYYLMGDNRPNSEDSRYTGPVKRSALLGKASAIWLHYSPTTHSIDRSRIGAIDSTPVVD